MEKLQEYREEIEKIDEELAKLICKRMDVSLKIGQLKKENNLSIYDPKREETLREKNLSRVEEKYKKAVSDNQQFKATDVNKPVTASQDPQQKSLEQYIKMANQ